jgi:two-component system cell cycle response regulator DivK
MAFEEAQERREDGRLRRSLSQFGRVDAAQGYKALRQPFFSKRCRKRAKRDQSGIIWRRAAHGLESTGAGGWGGSLAKILIVEDNALNIKLFCDLLAAHGHEPEAVTDSRLAIDAARAFVPELVITDIQLPHVSGFELIKMIRADENLGDVPIMAVTAYSAQGDEERIRAAGAQSYVSKPISVVKFVAAVEELLEPSRRQEASEAPIT